MGRHGSRREEDVSLGAAGRHTRPTKPVASNEDMRTFTSDIVPVRHVPVKTMCAGWLGPFNGAPATSCNACEVNAGGSRGQVLLTAGVPTGRKASFLSSVPPSSVPCCLYPSKSKSCHRFGNVIGYGSGRFGTAHQQACHVLGSL